MASINTFAKRMERRADQISRGVERTVRLLASEVQKEIVEDTPQDTGAAASNWLVSVDSPLTSVIPPYSPGLRLGLGNAQNTQPAIQQGLVAVKGFKLGSNSAIFISNNVSYIGLLNSGAASRQTKPLIVQRGIKRAIANTRNKIKILD